MKKVVQQNQQASKWQHEWQRECEAIKREKGKRRRMQSLRRRVSIAVASFALVCAGVAGWSHWHKHRMNIASFEQWVFELSADAGFVLRSIEVQGAQLLTPQRVAQMAQLQLDQPLLASGLVAVRNRLESFPEIESAKVERAFPDTMRIVIEERKPVALWQVNGENRLLDKEGMVLTGDWAKQHGGLLVITGDAADGAFDALWSLRENDLLLREQMMAAQYVGARRWNIWLKGGMIVKLPDSDMAQAWQQFAQLAGEQQLLDRAVAVVDMRLADRLFITLDDEAKARHIESQKTTMRHAL